MSKMQLSSSKKKNLIVCLIIIGTISFGLKLYTVDFSIPVGSDNLTYTLRGIAHSNGDFSQSPKKASGWPLLIAPFFTLIDSDNFLDYSNVVRSLSMGISIITIIPVYLLGRKFFDQRYSLVMVSLFAFEPHLNFNSGTAYAEPLYILAIILSFYFILDKENNKRIFLAFLFTGTISWIRLEGAIFFLVISIIYFIVHRNSQNLARNYLIGFIIVILVISPMILQRYSQYDDPFYIYYDQNFLLNYEPVISAENYKDENGTFLDYIQNNGIAAFLNKFLLKGIINFISIFSKILFPYLIIIVPFGALFSLRSIDQNSRYIKSNWILILVSLIPMILLFSIFPERRYLFYLFPFLAIFGTIAIQRFNEYGLSTFNFSLRRKKISLIIIIIIILILSVSFTTLRYERPVLQEENEKMEFSKFLINNLNGNILDSGYDMEYLIWAEIDSKEGSFKEYKINKSKSPYKGFPYDSGKVRNIEIYGNSLIDFIDNGEEHELKYISINEDGSSFYKFLNDVYYNEADYPYLKKVFDSQEEEYQNLKVKVFEIDYDLFHKSNI